MGRKDDYQMVLRNMLMESSGYYKQWKRKKRAHNIMYPISIIVILPIYMSDTARIAIVLHGCIMDIP